MKKLLRVFSVVLSIALVLSAMPADRALPAFAEELELIPAAQSEALVVETENTPAPENGETPSETAVPDAECTEEPEETAFAPSSAPTAAPTPEPPTEPSAEPTLEATIEATIEPTTEPTTEPSAEPTNIPTAEPTVLPSVSASATPEAEPTQEPTPEPPAIDYTRDAGESPEFTQGYAEVLSGETILYKSERKDAKEHAVLGRGVVYAVSRSIAAPDRIEIAYNPGPDREVETAWTDAANLRPMNPAAGDEVERYLAACEKDEDARLYNENEAIPLRVIPCAYPQVEISLNRSSAVIGVDDNWLDLDVYFSDGGDHAVHFESSKPKYAKVDAVTGVVTGLRTGSAVITASTEYGELSCAVTIKKEPRSVSVKPAAAELAVGESGQLAVSFGSSSYGGSCRYESSDPSVVTVDENGMVSGVSKGTAIVSVYVYSQPKKPAKAAITVLGPATRLEFAGEAFTLNRGMAYKPELIFQPGERDTVVYSSDAPEVAAVDPDGTVRALSEGRAVITAVTPGGVQANCTVHVLPAPEEKDILLLTDSCKLGLKESFDMMEVLELAEGSHAVFSYESSKPKYVSVDADGVVKGLKKGSAVIRATAQNGIIRDLKVTVCENPKSVSFTEGELVVGVGTTAETALEFKRTAAYSHCDYSSSDEMVARVDAYGVVTGIAPGTAVITADPVYGKSGSCRVTVKAAPSQIGVVEAVVNIGLGEPGRRVVGTHDADSMCSFSYASTDENVVRIDAASGELTAVAEGSAEIIVSAHNGVTASCTVNVRKAPAHFALNESSIRIMVGEHYSGLSAIVDEGAASGLHLSSSKTKYAKIENGAIVGVRKGTAVITAKTYNGLTATCRVTVCEAPKSISFVNPEDGELCLGALDTTALEVSFKPADSYSPLTFHSQDESVAYYDEETGKLVAAGEGETIITVETLNGAKAACRVIVLKAPEHISALEPEIRMGVGEEGLRVQGVAPEDTLCSFSYESLNPEIAHVDACSGALTAVARGRAQIVIHAHNGVRAACTVEVTEAPESLTLSHENLQIIVGERNTELKGVLNDGAASVLTLTSSKPKYVKIEDGAIVGLRIGSAVVTATTYNGVTATCKVTVTAAPTAIYFEEEQLRIGCNEQVETAVGFRPSTTAGKLRFESDRPEVAAVDPETGAVRGVNAGTARITATSRNGLEAICTVQVCPAPSSVCFARAEYVFSKGMREHLEAQLSDGAAGRIYFESSDPEIVAVGADGTVTAVSEGTAEITARSYNGFTAVCTVHVGPEPALVYYEFDTLAMLKGDVIRLPMPVAEDANGNVCPANYSYKSSKASIAAVNADGEVKALRNGTAEITVTAHNGLSAYFELLVSDEIPPLKLSPASVELYTDGAGYAGSVQITSDSSASLSFASSDPGVAAVDAQGFVTAVSEGSALISAHAVNGSYASVEVKVHKLSTAISLGMDTAELGVGECLQLQPVLDAGTSALVSYVSDNAAVAQVDSSGLVKAVGAGSTLITASMINGKKAVLRVDVLPGPDSVDLGFARLALACGEEVRLEPSLGGDAENICRRLRYESSNPTAVSVYEDGRLAALAEGTAVITVESCNGLVDSCSVEVTSTAPVFGFETEGFSIAAGDRAELPVILNKEAIARGWSVSSSDPELIQIDRGMLTANALRAGEAVLTLSLNPDPAVPEAAAQAVSCAATVVSYASVELSASEIEVAKGESAALTASLNPSNLIGSFGFEIADPGLIAYDPVAGLLTAGETVGETTITFRTFNDTAVCRVSIASGTKYRALIIGEYNDSGSDRDLPFGENNLYTVRNTLRYSSVDGERYGITTAFNNPSKGSIRSLLMNSFVDADEDDVSLIYIMSHGYYGAAANDYYGYYFSIAPNYDKNRPSTYITADELMLALRSIPGNVILVLDSCNSGGFIRDARSELADCGNIAVFTAQTYDKGASFYVGKSESSTVEFFTYALCYGLGVQQRSNYLDNMPADVNDDGYVTVEEAFGYARKETKSLIAEKIDTYKKGSKTGFFVPGGLDDDWSQNPQKFIPDEMEDMVFYGREAEETPAA